MRKTKKQMLNPMEIGFKSRIIAANTLQIEYPDKNEFKRKIKGFINLLDKMKTIPVPSGGDCWYCLMKDSKTGQTIGGNGHLIEHIKEGYLHGSLILNSLIEAGYNNPGLIVHMNLRDSIKRALRRYLNKRLLTEYDKIDWNIQD